MSKKSRRKASLEHPNDDGATDSLSPTSTESGTTTDTLPPSGLGARVRGFFGRLAGRRKTWLLLMVLIAWAGVLIYNSHLGPKPGFLEFSSEQPDAQVLIQKEGGEEVPLDRGEKLTKQLEPGKYKIRLEKPNDNLKLQPNWFNLDPNGRAFVKLRKLKDS